MSLLLYNIDAMYRYIVYVYSSNSRVDIEAISYVI